MAFFVLLLFLAFQKAASAETLGFEFHHRFSDRVRDWAESGNRAGSWLWPERGSVDYYAALSDHDRVHRGRLLAGSDSPLSFSSGNETLRVAPLGFLHYAEVSVGTPGKSFFVALDTGSDLFWLPCECNSCAPTSSPEYGLGPNTVFNIYSPGSSSTSKSVPCSSSYCERPSQCFSSDSQCPYNVRYLSENTSTTGVLVQDVLRLKTDEPGGSTVEAEVIVGCGRTQTGHFLDTAAPNGLFGLGLDPISVPSILSKSGITSNSFSMCFSPDGVGRIRFGDQGSSDQAETPIIINQQHPTYLVEVTGINVGRTLFRARVGLLMDSGTSFTYLADPVYSAIAKTFDESAEDQRLPPDSRLPFEYCYVSEGNRIAVPRLGFTLKGGKEFPILRSVVPISLRPGRGYIYCLAIIKSNDFNIIGQNFMTGLRIVFDGERRVLGWKEFDCYDKGSNSSRTAAVSPSPAVSQSQSPRPSITNFDPRIIFGPPFSPGAIAPSSSGQSLSPSLLRGVSSLLLLCLLSLILLL